MWNIFWTPSTNIEAGTSRNGVIPLSRKKRMLSLAPSNWKMQICRDLGGDAQAETGESHSKQDKVCKMEGIVFCILYGVVGGRLFSGCWDRRIEDLGTAVIRAPKSFAEESNIAGADICILGDRVWGKLIQMGESLA